MRQLEVLLEREPQPGDIQDGPSSHPQTPSKKSWQSIHPPQSYLQNAQI